MDGDDQRFFKLRNIRNYRTHETPAHSSGFLSLPCGRLRESLGRLRESLVQVTFDLFLEMQRQEVFKPTLQYLKAEQFDAARTNTNYVTRFLNIKKNIDSLIVQASELVDDGDVVSSILILAQYDTSVVVANRKLSSSSGMWGMLIMHMQRILETRETTVVIDGNCGKFSLK